jgi:metal-sulfur cluster biosynthetic enzyme
MNTYIEPTISTTDTVMTREHVLALLRGVQDPHSGLDIVTLGWIEEVTVIHQEVIVALHPTGRICVTHYAMETAIERTLLPHLGNDCLRLHIRWNTTWNPAES